ncbi:C-type lectin domain family 4 member G-like [Glandiceps talaboti]
MQRKTFYSHGLKLTDNIFIIKLRMNYKSATNNDTKPKPDKLVLSELAQVETATCQAGWEKYGKSCYYISKEQVSWETARQTCVGFGGNLATDKDVNTHDFIKGMVESTNFADCNPTWDCNIWFGLQYSSSTGYKWVDGTSLNSGFTVWNTGEPNGDPSTSLCMEYNYASVTELKEHGNWLMGLELQA